MVRERIAWQNSNFRIIDCAGEIPDIPTDQPPASLADRVMDEIGDSVPFRVIEGGKKDTITRDRTVMVVFDSGEIPQIRPGITNNLRRNWDRFLHAITNSPDDGI